MILYEYTKYKICNIEIDNKICLDLHIYGDLCLNNQLVMLFVPIKSES